MRTYVPVVFPVSQQLIKIPDGKYLLVLIEDLSRFPIVAITSINAKVVIEKLDKIFSEYGIPEVLRTDNGQQFGFKHRKTTPIWPQAN